MSAWNISTDMCKTEIHLENICIAF